MPDKPTLQVKEATGVSGTDVPLQIEAKNAERVMLSGLPEGSVLSAGSKASDGTWTLQPADLVNLTVAMPAFSGRVELKVRAIAGTETSEATLPLTVSRVFRFYAGNG